MPNPLNDLLNKMVAEFNNEREVHPFGLMEDNIKNMFIEFETKMEQELKAFQDEVTAYISEQANKIRESGCENCQELTPTNEDGHCLICNQVKEPY